MKLDIPDEYIPRLIRALETYTAYERSRDRDERPYLEVAEFLKRKPPTREQPVVETKKLQKRR